MNILFGKELNRSTQCFKEKHTRTLLHEAGPRKWVFFRDDLDLKNNNNLALINLIYRLQKQKKAGYIPTNLFNLNGINTTEKLPGPYEGSGTDEQFDLGTLLNKTSATVMALVQEKKYNDPKHQPFHIKKYNILYNLFEKYRSKIDPIVFADIFKIIKDTFFSSEAQINDLIILLKLAPNKYGEMRDIINHNNSLKFINSSIKLIAYIIESEMSDGRQIDRRKLIMNIHDLARNLTVNYPNPNFEDYLYLYNNALKYSQNSEWIQVFNSKNPTTNIRKLTELFHSEKRNLEDRKALFNALKHFPCIGNSVDSSPSLIKKMFNYYLLLDPDESFPCIFSRAVELFNTELKRQERLKNVDSALTSLIYEKMHKIKQDGISYNAGWNNFESTILLKLENPSLYRDKIKLLMAFCETFNLMRGFSYSVRGISHDINEENLFRIWEKLLSGEINDAEQRALSKFLATTPSWVNEKTNRSLSGDEYFDLIRPTLSPSLIPIIYPALFGEEKFMQEGISFVGDQLDRLEPIAHHEKVRQILGNDERLIEKNYSLAVDQNPRRYVWLKEMVKMPPKRTLQFLL